MDFDYTLARNYYQDVEAVIQDDAPSGRKEFLLWRCPDVSKASPISESTRLMSHLMKRGVRVILFCRVNPHDMDSFQLVANLLF